MYLAILSFLRARGVMDNLAKFVSERSGLWVWNVDVVGACVDGLMPV